MESISLKCCKKNHDELDASVKCKLRPSPLLQEMIEKKQGEETRLNSDSQEEQTLRTVINKRSVIPFL